MVLVLPSKIDASYKKKSITMIGSYFTCIKKKFFMYMFDRIESASTDGG